MCVSNNRWHPWGERPAARRIPAAAPGGGWRVDMRWWGGPAAGWGTLCDGLEKGAWVGAAAVGSPRAGPRAAFRSGRSGPPPRCAPCCRSTGRRRLRGRSGRCGGAERGMSGWSAGTGGEGGGVGKAPQGQRNRQSVLSGKPMAASCVEPPPSSHSAPIPPHATLPTCSPHVALGLHAGHVTVAAGCAERRKGGGREGDHVGRRRGRLPRVRRRAIHRRRTVSHPNPCSPLAHPSPRRLRPLSPVPVTIALICC